VTRSYLDHASTSPLRPSALEAMTPWLSAADPGRVHTEGRMARVALEEARERIAGFFGTRSRQVILTSGASESCNSATYGLLAGARRGPVLISGVEHSAVVEPSHRYATRVIAGGVNRAGQVDLEEWLEIIERDRPSLVHCQLANHEVGAIQPVDRLAVACRERGVAIHVDAAAAAGHVRIAFDDLGVDAMSISAHKLGGPRGVGALLVRRGLRIEPMLLGGSQERARRAGLENVAGAVGFAAVADELAQVGCLDAEASAARDQTDFLRTAVRSIDGTDIYGPDDPSQRLPGLLCLAVTGVEAEGVLLGLDQAGVAAHSGSACASEGLEPSPVLRAMGVPAEKSLRLSVGWSTTGAEVERAAEAIPKVIARLRRLART
jgi:cysteine desulfurase